MPATNERTNHIYQFHVDDQDWFPRWPIYETRSRGVALPRCERCLRRPTRTSGCISHLKSCTSIPHCGVSEAKLTASG